MRIFFCGAQGVGKSTLVKKLALEYGDFFEVHDSMSHLFMKESLEQFEDSFQNKILLHCLNIFANNDRNIIMSRSFVDALAYNENNTVRRDFIKYMVKDLIKEGDLFIYIPIEIPLTRAGNILRDLNPIYQQEIDRLIKFYFNEIPEKFRFVVSGSLEERFFKLKSIIDERIV